MGEARNYKCNLAGSEANFGASGVVWMRELKQHRHQTCWITGKERYRGPEVVEDRNELWRARRLRRYPALSLTYYAYYLYKSSKITHLFSNCIQLFPYLVLIFLFIPKNF
jgi:hypothetical protein